MNRRALAVLSAGHLATDSCQGAVAALLPFLIADRGLSYGQASVLTLAATVSSSIVQPLFGHLSDRRSLEWLIPVGILLAGLGISLVGVTSGYGATVGVVVLSGVGVACFHPEASRYARYVSGDRKATGMSLFSVGGNAGFAVGPALVTPLVIGLGLRGTLALLALPLLAAVGTAIVLPRLRALRPEAPAATASTTLAPSGDRWGAFGRLTVAVAVRSIVYFGLMTFVPLYYVASLGTSKAEANAALTVMLIAGAFGTLVGGRLADRVGPRTVFVGSMTILPPLAVAFLLAGPGAGFVPLAAMGCAVIATFSVTIVIGHDLLPGHIGVASGVTLGLAIGVGGLAAPLLGLLADAHGPQAALEVVAGLPLLALAFALSLPGRRAMAARRRAATPA